MLPARPAVLLPAQCGAVLIPVGGLAGGGVCRVAVILAPFLGVGSRLRSLRWVMSCWRLKRLGWSWSSEGFCNLFLQFVFVIWLEKDVLFFTGVFCECPVAGGQVTVHVEGSGGGDSGDVRVVVAFSILPRRGALIQVQVDYAGFRCEIDLAFKGSFIVSGIVFEPICDVLVDRFSLQTSEGKWEVCGRRPVRPLSGEDAAFVNFVRHCCVALTFASSFRVVRHTVLHEEVWF